MNMYYGVNSYGPSNGMAVWSIVSLILAIIGSIVVYTLFLVPDKKYNNKFVSWLKEFLNFNKMTIEIIIKIVYLFCAIFITLYSLCLIGTNFLMFLLTLTLGNVLIRIVYEGIIMMVMIWKNTTEINKSLKK